VIHEKQFSVELNKLSSKPWSNLSSSYYSLYKAALESHTLDPKFNTIHWAHDVALVCEEIKYSIISMRTYASAYKEENLAGSTPSSVSPSVAYYADNAITRIHSCRDKIALMVWAYFCPFNPLKRDEVLDYIKVKSRLDTPFKYGITIDHHELFLVHLNKLDSAEFKRITEYRHMKIHRREPQIEIYGVKSFHDWGYNLPVVKDIEIQEWEDSIKDDPFEQDLPGELRKQCTYDGVLYDNIKLPSRLWDYVEIDKIIESTSSSLVSAAVGCFKVLRRRAPFRIQKK